MTTVNPAFLMLLYYACGLFVCYVVDVFCCNTTAVITV